MKNIFIAGASGFIGRNLNEQLHGDHKIFAPSHDELDLLDADKVRNYVIKKKIELIINCANVGGGRDTVGLKDVVQTNLRIFFNLARCADRVGKIIHFGSGAEYDKSRDLKKVKEAEFDERVPQDDYGFYKYVCSKYIESQFVSDINFSSRPKHSPQNPSDLRGKREWDVLYPAKKEFLMRGSGNGRDCKIHILDNNNYNSKFFCLRLFGVYGKYENYKYKFISNSIIKNLLHLPIIINQNVVFDWLYVDDLVKIVEYYIENYDRGILCNIASGERASLVEIARIINQVSDFQSEIKVVNKGMNYEYTADNRRLRKAIPGLKFTKIEEGIKKLFGYDQSIIGSIERKEIEKDEMRKYCKVRK